MSFSTDEMEWATEWFHRMWWSEISSIKLPHNIVPATVPGESKHNYVVRLRMAGMQLVAVPSVRRQENVPAEIRLDWDRFVDHDERHRSVS